MRFEESRSLSRQQGTRSFAQAKNRYYPTRDETEEEIAPHSDASNHRRDSFRMRGRKSNKLEAPFGKPASRRRALLNESDESSPESNDASREPDHGDFRRRSSDFVRRESPYGRATQENIQPSYEEESDGLPSDSRHMYSGGNRNSVLKEDHRQRRREPRQIHWQQSPNVYDDGFSRHSDSKSHSSSDSSSSYSSSSDDDDFQLNANCMNALFSKDAERATSLIRCDKAGPSATEVQLKMTLPLPLQLMEGIDNLVPSKKEFVSAIKHLRYNGDRFAKKCDFDYNRLDEQVIIDEEFAGEVMPEFYKSLFESPTDVTSDGEDEPKQHQGNSAVRRIPEGSSALDVNPNHFRFTAPQLPEGGTEETLGRPESLPSHIMLDGDGTFVSSQGSFEMNHFGATTRQAAARPSPEPSSDDLQTGTHDRLTTKMAIHSTIYAKKMQPRGPSHGASQVGTQRDSSVQPSMRELIEAGSQAGQKAQQSRIKVQEGKLISSNKSSPESVQEHPSFDEGHISKPDTLQRGLPRDSDRRRIDEIPGQRQRNALSKFSKSLKTNLLPNKEWIPAKKEQLDLVDQAYPSFEVPEDELPKRNLRSPKQAHGVEPEAPGALVDGIPSSVDYRKKSYDRELGTVYSDLTVDEEAFARVEYPVVRTLTLSDRSSPTPSDQKKDPSALKEKQTALEKEPNIKSTFIDTPLSFGDELMGHREKLSSLGSRQGKRDWKDDGLAEKPVLLEMPSEDQGPLDELMDTARQHLSVAGAGASTNNAGKGSRPEKAHTDSIDELGAAPKQNKKCSSEQSKSLPLNSRKEDHLPSLETDSLIAKRTTEAMNIPDILTPVASIDQCASADIPMDEPKKSSVSSGHRAWRDDTIEEPSIPTRGPSTEIDKTVQSCIFTPTGPSMSSRCAENFEREKTSPHSENTDRIRNEVEDGHETANSLKNASRSNDFAVRLKSAAAARLDAMNDNPTFHRGGRGITASLDSDSDEEASEEINQGGRDPSGDKDGPGTGPTDPDGSPHKDAGFTEEKNISESNKDQPRESEQFVRKPCSLSSPTQYPTSTQEEKQESDIFVDASCQDFLDDAVSEEETKETAIDDNRIRYLSEIDDRSQAVEINYIGERTSRLNDSQSLATEPPLITAPTATTLETPLSTSYTMYTMDTPVQAPPTGTFDTMDRSAWGSGSLSKKGPGSRNDFYEREHDEDDYHFDERLAKLSALLPASKKRKEQTRDFSAFNLGHLLLSGMTAIALLAVAWLKHITGFQRERKSASTATKGEPNFRGSKVALGIQSTNTQRIQGNKHIPHELYRMEQEAGTFVDFIVPDIHGSAHAQQHPSIWSVNSSSQSSRKSQRVTETYSSIVRSFSRGDAKSVASMRGWSAKPDFCSTEFREE